LGILDYENLATDGDIDWTAMERPLDTQEAQSHEQGMPRRSRPNTRSSSRLPRSAPRPDPVQPPHLGAGQKAGV
jgi:hypothetical protein